MPPALSVGMSDEDKHAARKEQLDSWVKEGEWILKELEDLDRCLAKDLGHSAIHPEATRDLYRPPQQIREQQLQQQQGRATVKPSFGLILGHNLAFRDSPYYQERMKFSVNSKLLFSMDWKDLEESVS